MKAASCYEANVTSPLGPSPYGVGGDEVGRNRDKERVPGAVDSGVAEGQALWEEGQLSPQEPGKEALGWGRQLRGASQEDGLHLLRTRVKTRPTG